MNKYKGVFMGNIVRTLFNYMNQERRFAGFSFESGLSYSDIVHKSYGIAKQLKDAGLFFQARIILLGGNTRNFILTLLACWINRAIVLPEELNIDDGRLAKLKDTFLPDYIINTKSSTILNTATRKSYYYQEDFKYSDYNNSMLELLSVKDKALCIFTSGSTGKPKGVLLSHNALYYGAINVIENFKISSEDIVFCVLPMTHINGIVTTFITPLLSGSEVYYYQGLFETERAISEIISSKSTWLSAIPMHYSMFADYPVSAEKLSKMKLKFCRSASSPLSQKILEKFEKNYSIPLIETMGMTETSGQIFANPLPPDIHKPNSVGKLINYSARILDENGYVVDCDRTGELQVTGNSIMEGYLDDKSGTENTFDNNWLITGDLASMDKEGYFYLKGRKKNIAIYSGINISLSAIDMLIKNYEEIYDAVSITQDHENIGQRIIIAIIIKKKYLWKKKELIDLIINDMKSYLPSINVLEDIMIFDVFPRTPVGKIDVVLLKEIITENKIKSASYTYKNAIHLISSVLNVPIKDISENSKLGDFKEWDSLGNVLLMTALESYLERELDKQELKLIKTVKGINTLFSTKS